MQNINSYSKEYFQQSFSKTTIYQNLIQDFDIVTFDKNFIGRDVTPREYYGVNDGKTFFSAVSFYYLQFLLDKDPQQIYDLGCGWNIFKKYIPTIVGVGAEDPLDPQYAADIHDFVDDEYIAGHQGAFESVFSICALHFHPVAAFSKIVSDFYSMIKPGGRGFISLNSIRLIERDPAFAYQPIDQVEQYYRTELSKLTEIKFLVIDIDLTVANDSMDGNIRLVLERPIM